MAKAPCSFFFLVKREKKRTKSSQFFQFRFVCGIFFLNHLAPPPKGELMPKAPCFFFFLWLRVQVTSLNLIAFIISIESKASLLALAKSIYYPWYCSLYLCCMSVSVSELIF